MRDDLTHLPFLFFQNFPCVFGIKTQKILANSQFLYYYGHTSGRKWCKVVEDGCYVDEVGVSDSPMGIHGTSLTYGR